MTPTFRIVADGAYITALINDRLLSLRTTDKPGMESDDFELRIDDRDSAVSLPSRGASIEIFLGYTGTALTRLGRYTVDEVELSGPPDTLVMRGKASDMRGSGKTTRSGSWEGVSLASIVNDVAARNGWLPVCPVVTEVPRADQLSESDFNFITRLAKQYDCTAKVADGKLLVMPHQAGQSASGLLLGAITLTRSDVSRWQFRLADRSAHKAVSAKHQDQKTGKLQIITLSNDDAPDGLPPVHTDRHIYPNKSAAEQAAKARLSAFNRSTAAVRPPCVGFFVRTNPMPIRQQQLLQILPNAGQSAGVFVSALNTAMNHYQIVGLKRVAAFIAQIGHESGQLKYVKEIWGPAAQARYEGRADLGNTVAGDGSKYRGRGLIQITGRANYKACGEALSLDLINHPELLEKPQHACMSAAWFWATKGLNTLADAGQFDKITQRINGGQNGAADRQALYARALKVLA